MLPKLKVCGPERTAILEASQRFDGYLLDLDGTLISGTSVLPGASEFLSTLGERSVVISNNSTHTPVALSRLLKSLGLRVPPERLVLAGHLAVRHTAMRFPGARVMAFIHPRLARFARHLGVNLVNDPAPDIVLLCRDTRFDYSDITRAAAAISNGAHLIVANPDRYHPGQTGSRVPETGALLQAIQAVAGPFPFEVIGKPSPQLFREAIKILGTKRNRTVLIGDTYETDAVGAEQAGISCFLIGKNERAIAEDIASISWEDFLQTT